MKLLLLSALAGLSMTISGCSKQYSSAEVASVSASTLSLKEMDCDQLTRHFERTERAMFEAKRELNSSADRNKAYQAGAAVMLLVALPFIKSNEAEADQYAVALGKYEAALETAEAANCL